MADPASRSAGDFRYVDTAVGGIDHRNRVMRHDDFRPDPATVDCFCTYCRFGDDFPVYVANNLNARTSKPSVARYPGPALATFWPGDLDDEDDPARALAELGDLVRRLDALDAPLAAVRLAFSGCKGFSVELPAELFGGFPPSADIARRLGAVARCLLDGLATADFSIYEKLRLWRRTNTRHGKTGLHKIRISAAEAIAGDMAAIRALAASPRDWTDAPDDDWEPVPALVEAWAATAEAGDRPRGNRRPADAGDRDEERRPDLRRILAGCGYLRHCRDSAATLPEPDWHAMITVVAQCRDGERWAHELSAPYPDYDPDETRKKYDHARREDKPLRCRTIRDVRSGEGFCSLCPSWGEITSPIELGYAPPAVAVVGRLRIAPSRRLRVAPPRPLRIAAPRPLRVREAGRG
jgi:hypothetical protein